MDSEGPSATGLLYAAILAALIVAAVAASLLVPHLRQRKKDRRAAAAWDRDRRTPQAVDAAGPIEYPEDPRRRPDPATGCLFEVRFTRSQWGTCRWAGAAAIAMGALMAAAGWAFFWHVGAFFLPNGAAFAGMGWWLLWRSRRMRRFSIRGLGRRLWVNPLVGRPRIVEADDILVVKASSNHEGGMKAAGQGPAGGRRTLFEAIRSTAGYGELFAWVRTVRPDLFLPEKTRPL